MSATVKRTIPFVHTDDIFEAGDIAINFSSISELKLIASDFMDGIKTSIALSTVDEYEKKVKVDSEGIPCKDKDNNPVYELDNNGNYIDATDENGKKILKLRPDGTISKMVPAVNQYEVSLDGINAYWLLLKNYVLGKSATAIDINRARHVCLVLGMTKRWASIANDFTVEDVKVPLDGTNVAPVVSVPLD